MKPQITKYQLFTLILLTQIGTTTLFAIGIDAKQDAWLAVLLAMLCGFVLLGIYTQLQMQFPRKNLAEIIIAILGKPLVYLVALLYALNFIRIANHNLCEFSEIVNLTLLDKTPRIVIFILFISVPIYALFCGLNSLTRASELLIIPILFFLISSFVLITISGEVNLNNLMPTLENGITPVLEATFPMGLVFPFGEMVVFLMYWCYLEQVNDIKKISFAAVGISGILVTVSSIIIISTLGVNAAETTLIPLYQVVKKINVGNFIRNIDAIALSNMIIGGFFKFTIMFYAGISVLSTLFKTKNESWLIIIGGIFTLLTSYFTIPNIHFQRWVAAEVLTPYITIHIQITIPLLLLLINILKTKVVSIKDSA